jgi:MFS superfamily sulfate permease-like transporter
MAGFWVGLAVLVLSLTGLISLLTRWIPVPVVKGIQLGAGLSLIISAGASLLRPLGWVHSATDNRLWALAAFLALLLTSVGPLSRIPYALMIFLVGVLLAIIAILSHGDHLPHPQPWHPSAPSLSGLKHLSALYMALAQLPLTTLNSIIAASALAADLSLPQPSTTALGLSVAVMNLVATPFGAMPVCHGAGGLAAQYRFGARSGASIVLLGLVKVLLGLVWGDGLRELLGSFPRSLLGIMVIAAGIELTRCAETVNQGAGDLWEDSVRESSDGPNLLRRQRQLSDHERSERWTVMLVTAAGILAFKNDAVGFAAGMLAHWTYRLGELLEKRRQQRHGGSLGERSPLLR